MIQWNEASKIYAEHVANSKHSNNNLLLLSAIWLMLQTEPWVYTLIIVFFCIRRPGDGYLQPYPFSHILLRLNSFIYIANDLWLLCAWASYLDFQRRAQWVEAVLLSDIKDVRCKDWEILETFSPRVEWKTNSLCRERQSLENMP